LNDTFQKLKIAGIKSQVVSYTPSSGLYANEVCNGLKFSVTEASQFFSVSMGIKLLYLIISFYPNQCNERLYVTRANPSGKNHLDKLTGVYQSFEKIKSGVLPETKLTNWKEKILPYLLY
jgi:uncharacterized protein YbbC (DUF1343 family)